MKKSIKLNTSNIYCGDARVILQRLPTGSIDCCITSPPYYNLRDYGVAPLIWKDGWVGALGLEPHVDLYILHLIEVCMQIYRVLKPRGVFWLNIGDTYCSERSGSRDPQRWPKQSRNNHRPGISTYNRGVKRKELFLVPARLSLALQAAGWYVRQDIIWNKRNPMPESVTDRCTKSHEYIFLLTKSPQYYSNFEAIKEPMVEYERLRRLREKSKGLNTVYNLGRDGRTGLQDQSQSGACRSAACRQKLAEKGLRNKRSVWTTSTNRFKGNHFATFPGGLIEPMIKAGCPEGGGNRGSVLRFRNHRRRNNKAGA